MPVYLGNQEVKSLFFSCCTYSAKALEVDGLYQIKLFVLGHLLRSLCCYSPVLGVDGESYRILNCGRLTVLQAKTNNLKE